MYKYLILPHMLAMQQCEQQQQQRMTRALLLLLVAACLGNVQATTTTTSTSTTSAMKTLANNNDSDSNNTLVAGGNAPPNDVSHAAAITADMQVNENDFEQILSLKLKTENAAAERGASKKALLSRKRRYLLFPEGSSFQLVYDAIYGVVDYTNYLILGITVALAWELPSKPQDEVIEEIANRLKDGTLDVKRNDTISKIKYVDTKKKPTNGKMANNKPNYINFASAQQTGKQPYYNAYYSNNKKMTPIFRPPMHVKYYYDNNNNRRYYQRPVNNYYSPWNKAVMARRKYLPLNNRYQQRKSDWRRKDFNYYSRKQPHPFTKWMRKPIYGQTPHVKYPWWNLASRISNSLQRRPGPSPTLVAPITRLDNASDNDSNRSQWRQQQQQKQQQQQRKQQGPKVLQQQQRQPAASGYYQSAATARKHRIYPVFGKRSIPDDYNDDDEHNSHAFNASNSHQQHEQNRRQRQHYHHHRQRRSGIAGPELSRMERIHIRHHRSTRHTLYDKIEKYLDKLGIRHSHQCVLRALCETGQKSVERTPGTFVGELMRAVFTLPEALEEDLHAQRVAYKAHRYDTANAFHGDCAARYQNCKKSLWQSEFVA